jgi:hypothetical protein
MSVERTNRQRALIQISQQNDIRLPWCQTISQLFSKKNVADVARTVHPCGTETNLKGMRSSECTKQIKVLNETLYDSACFLAVIGHSTVSLEFWHLWISILVLNALYAV